jgi:Flp pilus assembly pilin Flp
MLHLMVLSTVEAARATLRGLLSRLHLDERGQDTAEYLVMTGVVVAIIVGLIWAAYSGALQDLVRKVGAAIDAITFS